MKKCNIYHVPNSGVSGIQFSTEDISELDTEDHYDEVEATLAAFFDIVYE